jgi:3-methyladenine DNA glycosylase/8-oxoguanine DNA glycosylase
VAARSHAARIEEGARVLAKRDRVLARMLKAHGVPELRRRGPRRTRFAELCRMICYQQLAGRAAAAIHGRFEALFDGSPTPEAVLAIRVDKLRGAGLSAAKTASIRDLAEKVHQGLVELDRMSRLSDETVVKELVLVRGIGEWTAHMFLMFQLGRLDIWPVLDFGVRAGFTKMYGLPEPPKPKELEKEGEPFRPYRSLVAWWCWREADTVTPD